MSDEPEEFIKIYGASDDLIEVRSSDKETWSEVSEYGGGAELDIREKDGDGGVRIVCHYDDSVSPDACWSVEITPLSESDEVDWPIEVGFDRYRTIATVYVSPDEVEVEGSALREKDWE